MNVQRDDVKYFPVATNDQLCVQCLAVKMTQNNDKKIDIENNSENGSKIFLYMSVCVANLLMLAAGLALGWTSPVIPKLNGSIEPNSNPLPVPLTAEQTSWIGSLLPLGAVFGPFVAGFFIDKIGRKKTLLVIALPFIIAFDMAIFINNVNLFYLMRFLCGLSVGGVFTVLPIYVGEISESSVRGTLGSLLGLFVCFGILASYAIGPYVSLTSFNIICSIVPTIFMPLFLIFFPDSPHFLISANYEDEAEKVLMKLRGKSRDGVQKELIEIRECVEASSLSKMGLVDIFRSKGSNRALMLAAGLVTFQQMSGINVVLFYTQTIFVATGSSIPPEICTIIIGTIQLASTLLTPILADKTGKRFLLIISATGMFLSEAILGLYFYLQLKLDDASFLFCQFAMNDEREDVKYFPVGTNDQLYTQCISEKMSQSNEKKLLEEVKNESGRKTFLYVAVCVEVLILFIFLANLVTFATGLGLGWSSPVIPKLNGKIEPESNPLPQPLTPEQSSWVGSLLPLGAAFGPFAVGLFIDKIGRKKTLLVATLPILIGFYMAIFINNVNLFFLMRFLCGLTVGGVFTVLPIYTGEIADSSVRGALGSLICLFACLGILAAYIIGPYVSLTAFNIICAIVPTVFIPLFLIYIPESPYYLVSANYEEEAIKALMKFRGKSRDSVQKELIEIKQNVEVTISSKISIVDIFRNKASIRALMLVTGLLSFQQLSGINVVLFYTQTIFAATGSNIPPEICTIIIGSIQVLSLFLTPVLAERVGKRFLLILSATGMSTSEAILGLYFYFQLNSYDVSVLFWLPILSLVCFTISYNLGFGPLPWAIMGELFSASAKSVSSTITSSICWFLAFIITKFFSNIAEVIGIAGSFWVFSGCCAIAFVFTFKLLPETSGKSFQEIQDMLNY
ncbi:hypothetical protein FQR65_LT03399 [Abscondita terminalis]|nr:hypothetical protein FQR65_LT03399 [Abscondita terminalis]